MKITKLKDAVLNNKVNYKKLGKSLYKKTSHKSKLIIGGVLASTLAISATAGSFDDDKKEYKESKHNYNMEFKGEATNIPIGYEGAWTIAGKSVIVDKNTILEFEDGEFKVGDEIEVHGIRDGKNIKALKIEKEDTWF